MTRRIGTALCVAAVIALATLGLSAHPAAADAPRDQGWWTATSVAVPDAPVALPAAPVANPSAPDVPARGLLIQAGGGGAPTAYSALLYELDEGMTATKLTLQLAPNTVTTPMTALELCPLLQPINHPEQGGPLSDAPPYNCAKNARAAPGSDQKSYEFDVSGLVTDKMVAVAILPTGPTDRVVLNAPDQSSLATQAGSSSAGSNAIDIGSGAPEPVIGSDVASSAPVGNSVGMDSAPSVTVGDSPIATPAPAVPPRSPSGQAGSLPFIPVATSTPEKATPLLVVLFIVAGLGGAALWLYAGRQRRHAGHSAISV